MGRSLAEAFPDLPRHVRRSRRGAGRAAQHALLRGARGSADADREHAAGDSRDEHRGGAARGVARACSRAFAAGHSLGEYSAHVAAGTLSFADALRTVRRRGRYMQEAVPVGEGAMAAILGLDAEGVAQACAEAARGTGRLAGESQRSRTDRDCRARGGRGARRRARQGARRQARDSARGQRALPLRADEAGRGSPGAGAARAGRRTIRRSRSSPTSTRSRSGRPPTSIEALVRQVSSPVRWEDVVQAPDRRRRDDASSSWAPARCSPA